MQQKEKSNYFVDISNIAEINYHPN